MRRAPRFATVVALLLAGCAEGGERAGQPEFIPDSMRYGGTAVVAYHVEPSSMNQFASVDNISLELQNFVLFTTLIRYDENLQPAPYLAERWDTAAASDGIALSFHLHDDVHWHDGRLTTAHDVKFTFDRIKDPRTAFPNQSLLALYDSAAVQDSFTITFYLRRHPGYLDPWRRISPMPEHILGNVAPTELGQHRFGSESPLGNGPFRFVEHRSGDRWVFEAVPDFPQSLGGRPYIDRLVYRVIEESTTSLSELLAGEVDICLSVEPHQVVEIDSNPTTRVLSFPSLSYAFIAWNGRRPLFQDARVRRALTLAINREQILQTVRHGLGIPAKGPVPPFHWAYHEDLEPLPYDPDSARALLDSAGWMDRDGDGIRERDVIRASFELRTHPRADREDIMTLVQADLAKVGFEVRLRVQEAQSLRRDITSRERPFDAFVLGWTADFRLDDRILFACSQLDAPFQWASYCNPRVDELLDQVTRIEDRSQALPLWHEYQEILQWEQPYTFLYYEVRPNGVRERIRKVKMDARGDLVNVTEWWIEPAARRSANR